MKKVKIGIIGTGVGIRTHLKAFRMVKNAEVVGGWDTTIRYEDMKKI